MDINNNSLFLEMADEVIKIPPRDAITIKDPELYMNRLREITTPAEQMKQFTLSIFNLYRVDPTHEGRWTRQMSLAGFITGWLLGGIRDSKHLHDDYARQHNASVFNGHYRGKRHKYDTFVLTIIRRGMPFAFKAALLCLGAGYISFASVTYRSRLYYPDWALGFATFGALSRSWLGLRGLVGGAGLGLVGGTIGFGMVRISELMSGMSVQEFRYHQEIEFAAKRQALRERLQRVREGWIREKSTFADE